MFDSPATTYSDTTPHKRVITDVISLIDPSDAPAVNVLGGLDGGASKLRLLNWPSTVYEWLQDTLISLSGALNGSITSTVTTITVADASNFQEGHIIEIDSEQMWVSDVGASEILTVTRNFGGTQATHADAAVVTIVGIARLEGDDSDDIAMTDRTTGSNVTQIFHQEVKASRSVRQISQYGIADELAYQADKAVPSLMRLVEKALFKNAAIKAGSATTPRTMGGLKAFITTNKGSGATLAQSQFENACKSIYNAGGSWNLLAFVHPDNKQKIKNWYDSTNYLRIDRTEKTVGMVIDTVETPFGNVGLVMSRWAESTVIPIVDPQHAGLLTFYPFTQEDLAKTGDADKAQVVGEFGFALRQEKAHALLTAVS